MPGQLAGADRLKTVIVGLSLAVATAFVTYLALTPAKPAKKRAISQDKKEARAEPKKDPELAAPSKEIVEEEQEAPPAPEAALPVAATPHPDTQESTSEQKTATEPVMNPVEVQQKNLDKKAPASAAEPVKSDKMQQSWSQLVEDEETQDSLNSQLSKMEISNSKPVPLKGAEGGGSGRHRSGSNRRHDSGVVSPNDSGNHGSSSSSGGGGGGGGSSSISAVVPSSSSSMVSKTDDQSEVAAAAPAANDGATAAAAERVDDGGLGSSVCDDETAKDEVTSPAKPESQHTSQQQQPQNSSSSSSAKHINGSDSGQGSEADDGIRLAYHFYIPHYLCGKFIGVRGSNIQHLKTTTKCSVQLRQLDENGFFKSIAEQRNSKTAAEGSVQVCLIEGTRTNIDHCLELIRQRFPTDQYPELTLEQINLPSSNDGANNHCDLSGSTSGKQPASAESNSAQPLQLGLTQGALHDVFVSHIVSGGHIFLQQPNHPTHSSLARLEDLMSKAYCKLTSIPDIPREVIEPGLVCVARCYNSKWYRVQVVRYDAAAETADVKFVDHGGYYNFPIGDLKQIRSDYLALPFQALECYLGNVIPLDGREWSVESGEVLRQMVQGVIISGRMLGVNEEGVPIVHLYGWVNVDSSVSQHEQQPRLLNRELVDRSVALWTEHIIAN